jgi:peptide deformylase
VERPQKVTVKAVNRHGEPVELTGEDFLARAICHELEHLDGRLYVDSMIEDVSDRYRQVKGE